MLDRSLMCACKCALYAQDTMKITASWYHKVRQTKKSNVYNCCHADLHEADSSSLQRAEVRIVCVRAR